MPSSSATFGLAPPAMSAIISSGALAVWRGDRPAYGQGGVSNGSAATKLGLMVAIAVAIAVLVMVMVAMAMVVAVMIEEGGGGG